LGDGTALIIINPINLFGPQSFSAANLYLPFVSVANGSTTLPFVTTPTYTSTPFSTQYASVSTYALDSLIIDFI